MHPIFRGFLRTLTAASVAVSMLVGVADAQICFPPFGCEGGDGPIDVSVVTDRPSYVVGDPIQYSVIAHNPSNAPISLKFPSSLQADFTIDGIYSPDDIGLTVITGRTIAAGGYATWDFFHPWDDYSLVPGSHSVVGEVINYGVSSAAQFSVEAPAPVVEDVLIDFDHLPNGAPTYDGNELSFGKIWKDAYVRDGVHFRSQGGSVNFTKIGDSAALHTPTAAYPPGFNIIADFDMPVFSVSADVGSAAGKTITMHAFDAAGQPLGSVTSDPVTNFPNLVGPLSFDSTVPIASVQWFSSATNASVRIDNLFLNVDLGETLGDFNGDGRTNAVDYTFWRDRVGTKVPLGSGADGNHNGTIDYGDYDLWKSHFVREGSPAPLAVPEPSSMLLLISLLPIAARPRRPTRR